jgi:predicted transcriptional regulator
MANGEAMRNALRKRNQVLRSLNENPQSKSELTNNIDVSRSTIERAIRTLQRLGCIRIEGRRFYITTSGKVALDTYQDYVAATDDITENQEVINSLPDDISIDHKFVNGASKNIADPRVPETALRESNELLHSAKKLTGLAPLSLPSYPDLLQSGSVEILRELHVRRVIRRDEGPPEVANTPVY